MTERQGIYRVEREPLLPLWTDLHPVTRVVVGVFFGVLGLFIFSRVFG